MNSSCRARFAQQTLLQSVVRIYAWNEMEWEQCRLLHWQFLIFPFYAHKHAEHFLTGYFTRGSLHNTVRLTGAHSPRNGSKLYANTHWSRENTKFIETMVCRTRLPRTDCAERLTRVCNTGNIGRAMRTMRCKLLLNSQYYTQCDANDALRNTATAGV